MKILSIFVLAVCSLAWLLGDVACAANKPVQFQRDVLPILAENCFACHGFDKAARQAGLRLDVAASATGALESGARAIVPGKPEASELIARTTTGDIDLRMPPAETGKSLTAAQLEVLGRWIAEGAVYEKPWAFAPPVRAVVPVLDGVEHPIDRFIQARLAEDNLRPSSLASDTTLIRRVCLDLTGLPPTPAEVDAFTAAAAKDRESAYRELVERLLASPHYGEHWGRWWLDQARYADSNGYSIDSPREIWKFRDWVIEALNADMPFDQFTTWQLAGDLLPGATEPQKVATGFHRNTQINQEGGIDREQFRVDSVFDRVATTGTIWLGLSIGCAQCHDHKFDPIEQREYYRLFAFFNNQDEPTLKVYGPSVDVPRLTAELSAVEKQLADLIQARSDALAAWEAELTPDQKKDLPAAVKKVLDVAGDKRSGAQLRDLYAAGPGRTDDEFQSLRQSWAELDRRLNSVPTTMVLQERATPRKTSILIKGDFTRPAEEVTPGTPAVLHPFQVTSGAANRLDLARWITSRENPLTARVIVNRVWQRYFGRGIVETENDFGAQGSPPSHPELLDWLALELQDRQWSLKAVHRLIVTSHTYRQASAERADLRAADPHNYLLARQRRLRLEAEVIRDVSLAASGLLSPKLGGPPVFPPIPEGVMGQGQVKHAWNVSAGEDRYRRGLYTFIFRATPPPALAVFDAPDGYASCTRRSRSNTPLQALTLLNDAAFVECATALARVVEQQGIEEAFRRCTARRPQPDEFAVLTRLDALSAARVLLNLDETMTRE